VDRGFPRRPSRRKGVTRWRHRVRARQADKDFSRPRHTKNPGTIKHHHLASPPTSLRHHDLVVAIINHFVALACGPTSKGTRHRRGLGQQPCSHARGIHLCRPSTLRGSHRPEKAARAHQAPSGPAEPKWVRKAPAALLQYAGRRAAVPEPLPVIASTTRMLGHHRAQPARAYLGPPKPIGARAPRPETNAGGAPAA
jgi:hypothetical protein